MFLQRFHYREIHPIQPCNKWLFNIKIISDKACSYCTSEDEIQHALPTYEKANTILVQSGKYK